jgi:hypothetical protein
VGGGGGGEERRGEAQGTPALQSFKKATSELQLLWAAMFAKILLYGYSGQISAFIACDFTGGHGQIKPGPLWWICDPSVPVNVALQ